MKIEISDCGEWLIVEGEKFSATENLEFEVVASRLEGARLGDLPRGVCINLCDRIFGTLDLVVHTPLARLCCTKDGAFIAHGETAFVLDRDDTVPSDRKRYFHKALAAAQQSLEPLVQAGILLAIKENIYDDIAYLSYSVCLPDQPFTDADTFVGTIEERIHAGSNRPLLFVCHACEDKPFVERLVSELDRRALYAWFDKREILVGDSIVESINAALGQVRFVLAVLSPRSVIKPWVLRELNSSLMRQLSQEHVAVLPVLLESCDIPPLLADLRYADFRTSFEKGFEEILSVIREHPHAVRPSAVGYAR